MSTPVPPSTSTSSPSVAPASTPPLTPDSPIEPRVRFEEECVLIPEPLPTSRIPRLITKSYSLPL
ncbi:hypothetical protein A0H81_00244 [Grifola frondosa]|uniref:Uncharacterized protein n=1 Tax=Grifola frondosa TaxID=5627 RepID=A0A1C7MSS6_GRIFR|nr:hypothetical protein A0H81_00244 [Grifola frondosa]